MLVCSSLCQNVVLRPFLRRKEMKIIGSQVPACDCGWLNTSHRKRFRSLFVAAVVCSWALSWRRTIPEDNVPRSLLWIKESIYGTYSTFGRRDYSFRHVYRAHYMHRTDKCDVLRSTSILDIVQHICAKLHLILTVVLISWPIGPWKKNSPRNMMMIKQLAKLF